MSLSAMPRSARSWRVEPARHGRAQHAVTRCAAALAGDDQHGALFRLDRTRQERIERAMRFFLRHAVEIESRLDREQTAAQALGRAAIEARRCIGR